jgi:mono/diheme cytochrome c family protein
LDVLWALLLIGAALFVGGILLRSLPTAWLAFGAVLVVFGLGIPALVIDDHKSETSAGSGSEAAAEPEATGGGGEQAGGGGEQAGGGGQGGGGGGNAALVAQGKQLFQQNCGTCHTLADAGTTGSTGPDLDRALRGQSEDELRTDIVDPNARIAPGYAANIMPPNFEQTLSSQQLDGLVAYLATVSK